MNNHISPNTVSQNDEIPHTARLADTAIPHVKIKITEIPHEKKKANTVNPHVPLGTLTVIFRLVLNQEIYKSRTFRRRIYIVNG